MGLNMKSVVKKNSPKGRDNYVEYNQKRKKKRFNWGRFFVVILIIAVIFGTFFYLFHTRKVHVSKLTITSEKDINKWFEEDKNNKNTFYSFMKINYFDCDYPPTVEKIKVKYIRPWEILLNVVEKDIAGYVDYKNKYLCFDDEGMAMFISESPVENATYVEGMNIKTSKVKIGKTIPVKEKDVFNNIVEISMLTDKYKLEPDRMVCQGSNINLYFGNVEVMLGNSEYEVRIAQISPILQELNENFSDESGTLHLENFHSSDKTVRFVPEEDDKQE